MSAAGIIVCRLFSGPHLGAELVLPAGQQVIGADDSCDVILQDGSVASRHAVLDIAFDADGTASVRVTPLDGEVLLDERPLPPDGAIIPERTPFFFGPDKLCVGPSGNVRGGVAASGDWPSGKAVVGGSVSRKGGCFP